MSEGKQVIHVKDLVIQADHVYVERSRRGNEHRHSDHGHRQYENNESSKSHHDHEHEQDHRDMQHDQRHNRPFGWF